MRRVFIVGVGMTRFGKHPGQSYKQLVVTAARAALADAGLSTKAVESAFVANALGASTTHQEMIAGQVALRSLGIADIPVFNVENACASASSALHLAWMSVASGAVDVSLALGCEVMTSAPKAEVARAIGRGLDVETYAQGDAPTGRSAFMELYASLARDYMERTGCTSRVFAEVAAKNYRHGAANELAQFGAELDADAVLASRSIIDPLTLLMCSPFSDGAAAAVIVSEDVLARCTGRPVEVLASVIASGSADPSVDGNAVVKASRRAYETAGIGPADLSLVELHDAVAPAEVWEYEDLGLASPGDGPKLVAERATSLGGRIPVNPSGGLVARGHPIGATGLGQIHEAVVQLRGQARPRQIDGARLALTQNAGGFVELDNAAIAIHILGRTESRPRPRHGSPLASEY